MAKYSKAELRASLLLEEQEYDERTYPARLMAVLFELSVRGARVGMHERDAPDALYSKEYVFKVFASELYDVVNMYSDCDELTHGYTKQSCLVLERLERLVVEHKRYEAEVDAVAALKQSELDKLTTEERKALGLYL